MLIKIADLTLKNDETCGYDVIPDGQRFHQGCKDLYQEVPHKAVAEVSR